MLVKKIQLLQKHHKMTNSKFKIRTVFSVIFFLIATLSAFAQGPSVRLSGGASIGYAPLVTFGETNYSGVITSINGDLEYGKIIGHLQYSKPIISTFGSNRLEDGNANHGSLGFKLELKEALSIGILLSGGATAITYTSISDEFINVSPQVGVQILPIYQFSKHFSLQAGARYYKGFEAGDRGDASDLFDLSVGFRISL